MTATLQNLLETARSLVPGIDFQEAQDLLHKDDVVCLDVREGHEVATSGKIAGAVHISRGMLEMRAAPDSQMRHERLSPDKIVLVYCGAGPRAALAGKTLVELGYRNVRNLGGFKAWVDQGGAVDPPGFSG